VDVAALMASARGDSSSADSDAIVKAAKAGDHAALSQAIDAGRVSLDAAAGFDGNAPLHWAVEKGHLECVRLLCERGAKIDVKDKWQGWTPLMIAASKDRQQEAELLLSHGADPTLRAKGATAATLATSPSMLALLGGGLIADSRAGATLAGERRAADDNGQE